MRVCTVNMFLGPRCTETTNEEAAQMKVDCCCCQFSISCVWTNSCPLTNVKDENWCLTSTCCTFCCAREFFLPVVYSGLYSLLTKGNQPAWDCKNTNHYVRSIWARAAKHFDQWQFLRIACLLDVCPNWLGLALVYKCVCVCVCIVVSTKYTLFYSATGLFIVR